MGTKVPCGVGLLATAFLLWALGTPGPDGLSFVGSGERGQAVYMISILGLGIVRSLLAGCGIIEITGKSSSATLILLSDTKYVASFNVAVVAELQETQPDIFGPNGGFSRAYSLTNMCWSLSMFVGPILTGFITQTAGYYYMNMCLGETWCPRMAVMIAVLTPETLQQLTARYVLSSL